jgi:hypothetical protein
MYLNALYIEALYYPRASHGVAVAISDFLSSRFNTARAYTYILKKISSCEELDSLRRYFRDHFNDIKRLLSKLKEVYTFRPCKYCFIAYPSGSIHPPRGELDLLHEATQQMFLLHVYSLHNAAYEFNVQQNGLPQKQAGNYSMYTFVVVQRDFWLLYSTAFQAVSSNCDEDTESAYRRYLLPYDVINLNSGYDQTEVA